MKKYDFDSLIKSINDIEFQDDKENQIKAQLVGLFSAYKYNPLETKKFIELKQKELLSNNLLIHKEYSESIENLNKSLAIAIEKNTNQINKYHLEADERITELKNDFFSKKKISNLKINEEQKIYQKILKEHVDIYDEEISVIKKEIDDVITRTNVVNQRLEQEKTTKLEKLLYEYNLTIAKINNDVSNEQVTANIEIDRLKEIIKNDLQSKDNSYLSIKKTNNQSSIKLNDFINNIKKDALKVDEKYELKYNEDINKINDELTKISEKYEERNDLIQNRYLEQIKALNVVFDVQKNAYNEKRTEIIQKNNLDVSNINQGLRLFRENINNEIKQHEKNKWQELSVNHDLDARSEINKKYSKIITPLKNQIIHSIAKNEENLTKQEIIFQTELFNHDFEHVKQINEWRFNKDYYDLERKNNLEIAKLNYQHELFELEERKILLSKIRTCSLEINKNKLGKRLLPIETQLLNTSFLQNRDINILNVDFELNKLNNSLQQKLVELNYSLFEIEKYFDKKTKELEYNLATRKTTMYYQLEIEKEIIKRDFEVDKLNLNIELQKSLLKQKNDRYYKIFDGTVKVESLKVEHANKTLVYEIKMQQKRTKIENEKRTAIIQEIKNKNQRIINNRKNQRNISIAKNEAEYREEINHYYFDLYLKCFENTYSLYKHITSLYDIPVHPEQLRKIVNVGMKYLVLQQNIIIDIIDDYINENNKEFNQHIFSITDYKYRLKHEEILNTYNENVTLLNDKKKELVKVQKTINNSITETENKINQNSFLIKSYKKHHSSDLEITEEQINILVSENSNLENDLQIIRKNLKSIELRFKAFNTEFNGQLKQKQDSESLISEERKKEEDKYRRLFNNHIKKSEAFKEYIYIYFNEMKKRYDLLSKQTYLNESTYDNIKNKFSLSFKKNNLTIIEFNNKLLSFWLDLYLATKDEQLRIIENFDKSTSLAIKHIKKTYQRFIDIEEKDKTILSKTYTMEISNIEEKLRNTDLTTMEGVKDTIDFYNQTYQRTELAVKNNDELKDKKLLLTSENLEDALNTLEHNFLANFHQLKKRFEKDKVDLLTKIILTKNEIESNENRRILRLKAANNRYENQHKHNIQTMTSRKNKLSLNISKENKEIIDSNRIKEQNILKHASSIHQSSRLFALETKKFKVKGRIDQNKITKKERRVLKKSYVFKKRQLKSQLK